MFTLPSLPYEYAALEPHFDEQTMRIHHTKHHQTYVDKLNAGLEGQAELLEKSVEDLLRGFEALPDKVKPVVRNHGGGHANHSLFWTTLSAQGGGEPSGALAEALNKMCTDFATFKDHFTQAATGHFGSGWAWVVVNPDKTTEIITTPNQDSPLMQGKTPIMGLDVWEHAYYLKYQNKRPDYIQAFWNVVNWSEVSKRFEAAVA
ncbi:MAG TPA: superoxide dismutase [Vitreimonas sp.]|nr:superoxide dismutase [Vitreimonas sp.]